MWDQTIGERIPFFARRRNHGGAPLRHFLGAGKAFATEAWWDEATALAHGKQEEFYSATIGDPRVLAGGYASRGSDR